MRWKVPIEGENDLCRAESCEGGLGGEPLLTLTQLVLEHEYGSIVQFLTSKWHVTWGQRLYIPILHITL